MSPERRQFSRIAFNTPAQLISPHGQADVLVLDLSLKGALITLPDGWRGQVGEPSALRIDLDELGGAIRMDVTIAHVERDHAGLACRSIDLDSVTHLRRLIELNLGDEALLERELSALVAA